MKLRCIALGALVALLAIAAVPLIAGEDASEEAQQNGESEMLLPVSEPPIKRVHVLNPGEREYLSPNLIGVQNIAMTYLPLSMNFVNIIDAFREIVDGVRYEILLNAVDTKANDADIICRLVIIEKPWLRTEWGDKVRELRHSNCTSEEENFTDPMAKNRELNDKYESNSLFNGGTRNELSSDEMDKLTAQIMPYNDNSKKFGGSTSRATATSTTTTTTTTTTTESAVRDFNAISAAPSGDGDGDGDGAGAAGDDDDEVNTELKELSDDEKKWLDDILSVGALNFEKSIQRGRDREDNNDEGNDDVDDYQHDESSELSDRVERSQANLQQQESNVEDQQQQQRGELEMEQFEPILVRSKRSYNRLVGGPETLEIEEAHPILLKSLSKLAAGEGLNYTIGKIYSASRQLVSGTLTTIDAEIIENENEKNRCTVSIWSRPWLRPAGDEVTLKCPGKNTLKKRLTRSVEYAEKKTHKKHDHHNLSKTEHLFQKFKVRFNKHYPTTLERQMRLRIFKQNLKTIEELNRNEMGSAKYGITEFADMTSTEYKLRTGLWQRSADKPSNHAMAEIPDIELPKEFDWRQKGVISEVKNQGSCGSCWAFSVTGNIEGLHAVKTGKLEEYSEQELLDCDTIDSACNGGLPDNAYKAIIDIGGLELESEYPYEGRKEQCHFNKTLSHVQVVGAVDLPKNETAMAQWLIANGPISIGINANAMQFYRGGVSHPWRPLCSHSNLDHGVLIVGYGVSDYPMFKKTLPYWIVKNSWGKKWGEQGYYRVYRGDNTCGVSEMATSAVLA